MKDPYGYSATIEKAASRVSGDRLVKLYQLCEQQKSVSTKKLWLMLEDLSESDRLDAIHFKKLAEKLRTAVQLVETSEIK